MVLTRWGHPPPPHTHTPTHTSSETLLWLRQRFGGRLISRRCDTEWAARSPDFPPPPDLYLSGYLKDTVYEPNPQTIAELKRAITARSRIRTISVEECVRVIDNFARRLQVCLQCRGGHLEHILERT